MPETLTFPPTSGQHLVVPLRVIDGDTVVFAWLVQDTARLYGINTPEVHGEEKAKGLATRDYLAGILPCGQVTEARIIGRDKFGRSLLELFTKDGKSVNKELIKMGLALPWDGQGKKPTMLSVSCSPNL